MASRRKTQEEPQTLQEAVTEQAATATEPQTFQEALKKEGKELEKKKSYTLLEGRAHDNPTGVEIDKYASTENGHFEWRMYFRDGDPGPQVRAYLRQNGMDFDKFGEREASNHYQATKPWFKPVPYRAEGAYDDAQRIYYAVVQMMKREKGLEVDDSKGRF